jgi:hypothetical protein
MDTRSQPSSVGRLRNLPTPNVDPARASNRLTSSEIEQLRQDLKDAAAYLQKTYYPNVRLVSSRGDLRRLQPSRS